MLIKYFKISEQSDYQESGCLQIEATNPKDAFELGIIFGRLCEQNYETVMCSQLGGRESVAIRFPLKFKENDNG